MPQGIFIFGGNWQMRLFRFRPLFTPDRKRFFKPFHEGEAPSWNGCTCND